MLKSEEASARCPDTLRNAFGRFGKFGRFLGGKNAAMAVKDRRGSHRFFIEAMDPRAPKTLRPAYERAKGEEGSHTIPRLFWAKTLKFAQTMWADRQVAVTGLAPL
jgi:hypothetical protein